MGAVCFRHDGRSARVKHDRRNIQPSVRYHRTWACEIGMRVSGGCQEHSLLPPSLPRRLRRKGGNAIDGSELLPRPYRAEPSGASGLLHRKGTAVILHQPTRTPTGLQAGDVLRAAVEITAAHDPHRALASLDTKLAELAFLRERIALGQGEASCTKPNFATSSIPMLVCIRNARPKTRWRRKRWRDCHCCGSCHPLSLPTTT